jgi:2-octaprenyl-6-methoxyphenol hydroxylase
MMTGEKMTDVDVIIAGGGMIGTTAALALAPLGLRIALVEAASRSGVDQPSFDDRSTALSRSSQRLLEALGLWSSVVKAAAPIRHIHVSDQGRFGFAHIDAEQQHVDALGFVVINRQLGLALQGALATAGNVVEYCPARITAVEGAADAVSVCIEGDAAPRQRCRASLLVVADGARSSVREQLGIAVERKDYGQHAIIGTLETERPIGDTAYERFSTRGPLAVLPVPGQHASFVWTVGESDAARIGALADAPFLGELQSAFGNRLGAFRRAGTRSAYPLALSKALRVTARRSVLVGNAAHGLHPVAAQGFNLGLRDVATLADCIADALADGSSCRAIGERDVLERYAEWRRHDQRKLVGFTDGLVRLFTSGRRPLRTARDLGMLAFDLVPGVRREFARHTMGLAGRLPRLSRGVPLR